MIKPLQSPRNLSALVLSVAAGIFAATPARAITFGQIDDFQDGTTMSWQQGFSSPNPTSNIATGGPAGAGDHYLQNVSTGGFGAGSRQVMFNVAQWTGDYNSAGVTRINAMLANFGTTTLSMRVAFQGGPNFSEYSSTTAIVLPADGMWHPATFNLTSDAMSLVSGSDSLAIALGSVTQFRLLSSSTGPTYSGADPIASTLGVDNARALRLPGDANFDGSVNVGDLGALATNYNGTGDWSKGDFNFDHAIDVADLGILATAYGTSIPTSSAVSAASPQAAVAVPEPGTAALMSIACIGLCSRRRRGSAM